MIRKVLNIIQIVNWVLCLGLVVFFIFYLNSPYWFLVLEIGVGIQALCLFLTWTQKTKVSLRWIIIISFLSGLLIFTELENQNLIRSGIFNGESGISITYLSILISILLFTSTIVFIIKENSESRTN